MPAYATEFALIACNTAGLVNVYLVSCVNYTCTPPLLILRSGPPSSNTYIHTYVARNRPTHLSLHLVHSIIIIVSRDSGGRIPDDGRTTTTIAPSPPPPRSVAKQLYANEQLSRRFSAAVFFRIVFNYPAGNKFHLASQSPCVSCGGRSHYILDFLIYFQNHNSACMPARVGGKRKKLKQTHAQVAGQKRTLGKTCIVFAR